ncbi:hypothetical protein PGT21_027771 [Puccinia graminis f. sp. tritici]|uniref:Uncharacterized protein n=1 Tax=Puccinia graminis f. sp. tritici TaxID=56615 RepID=A0A5B0MFU7_PUCGR|nr:hypothetical protein PGTUg99_018691 [Puccinia graminis f. sp. tritici]KAA1091177.1 hypothetical protein PGT21_027771 [Puccinia graminis f. sp. tritici]
MFLLQVPLLVITFVIIGPIFSIPMGHEMAGEGSASRETDGKCHPGPQTYQVIHPNLTPNGASTNWEIHIHIGDLVGRTKEDPVRLNSHLKPEKLAHSQSSISIADENITHGITYANLPDAVNEASKTSCERQELLFRLNVAAVLPAFIGFGFIFTNINTCDPMLSFMWALFGSLYIYAANYLATKIAMK